MKEMFIRISTKIVKYCFCIFVVLFSISNIFFSVHINNLVTNYVEYNFNINIGAIVFTVLFLVLIYVLIKNDFFNINEKTLLFIFLIICFVLGSLWIIINHPILIEFDDAYNVFRSASNIATNNYKTLGYGTYISNYPNNIGWMTYVFIHIKLFGTYYSLYTIRFVNLFFVLFGYYSLYKITKLLFNNRLINCTLIVLCFGSMQYVFYSFFVYGNCLSYSLALLSVLFLTYYFENRKTSSIILSALFIILSISIKMNSLIIMIAEIIFILLDFLKSKKAFLIIPIIIMLLGSYAGTTGLQKYWGNKVNINYNNTKLPTICWIAYGFNYDERNPGHYLNNFENFHYQNGFMSEYTTIEAKNFINNVINEFSKKPLVCLKFYCEKFLVAWTNPQYETFDQYRDLPLNDFARSVIGGNINNYIDYFWDGVSSVISIGLLIYVFKCMKKANLFSLLCATIVLGGFFFHSFWEIKSVYIYQYFMYLLPYASLGLCKLFTKTNVNK